MSNNIEKAKQILNEKNIKVITLSGEPSSGKSTARRNLKEKYEEKGYEVKEIAIGEIFREISEKEGYRSIEEFNEALKKRKDIDERIDVQVHELGEKILKEGKENTVYLIDSRMAWKNIPYSFSVRLTSNSKVAGERAFNDKNREGTEKYETIEEAQKAIENRRIGEIERYKLRYGVDLENPDNYSLIINTAYSAPEEICSTIIKCEEYDKENKYYAKMWTSPVEFIPTQNIRDTFKIDYEQTKNNIKENGFYPGIPVYILEADIEGKNYKFAYDGHTRTISSILNKISLVPYVTIAKNNEKIPSKPFTANRFLKNEFKLSNVYDHEDAIGMFYEYIYGEYPDMSKLKEKEIEEER